MNSTIAELLDKWKTSAEELASRPVRGRPGPGEKRIRCLRAIIAKAAHELGVPDDEVTRDLGIADPQSARQRSTEAHAEYSAMQAMANIAERAMRRCDLCVCWVKVGFASGECRLNPPSCEYKGGEAFWPTTMAHHFCDKHRAASGG